MKSAETLKKDIGVLHSEEIKKITFIVEELNKLKKKKTINEDNLRALSNCYRELETLKEVFYWRLIKLLKQNHLVD